MAVLMRPRPPARRVGVPQHDEHGPGRRASHVTAVTRDLPRNPALLAVRLAEYSLETVQMLHLDGSSASV